MSLLPSELSLLLCACAAFAPFLLLRAVAPQSRQDDEVKALVARIGSAGGKPARAFSSLATEGTVAVTFEGVPVAGSVLNGTFREAFAGVDRVRYDADLGEQGAMQGGICGDVVWEIDPTAGPKVYAGTHAAAMRRQYAAMQGINPAGLYRTIVRTGTEKIDGREHVVLRMTAEEGKADTWYVDPETGRVRRFVVTTPASEGLQWVWGLDPEVDTQVDLGDWRPVDGVPYPHRRAVKVGPATFTFTCTKVESGIKLDPSRFALPEAVARIKRPASRPVDAATRQPYQIVENEAQPVASIRVKCKPDAISATLATILPEVMTHLNATGARMSGPPFSRYHGFGAEIDLEAGFPVGKPITEKGRIKNSELPAGKLVMAWHIGDYDKLADAHKALQAHLDANRLRSRGGPWEVYWTDPGMVPDASKWRTQLFMPIEN